jgi:hypothetical protein
MKALAQRLRGRRASRRTDDTERSFRFEEAVKDANDDARPTPAPADQDAPRERRHNDNWRRNRGLNSKTGSCNALAAIANAEAHANDDVAPSFVNSPALPEPQPTLKAQSRTASAPDMVANSPQQQILLARAHSTPRARNREDRAVTMSGSSSSGHSQGSSGRTRSRHGGSMSSNASFLSASNQKPEVAVDVRHSGYLLIKRGMLKVADKRYYFVARRSPELYSCKDETSFSLWLASGRPLDLHGEDAVAKASGLIPVLVGTVLRADPLADEGGSGSHPERMFSVMVGSASKCIALKFGAESGDKAKQWVEALQEVQVTKRHGDRHPGKLASASDKRLLLPLNEHNALRGTDSLVTLDYSASEHGDVDVENGAGQVLVLDESRDESAPVTRPASSSNAKTPRVYASGKLQSKQRAADEDEATAVSTPTSHPGSSPTSTSSEHATPAQTRLRRLDSVTSCSSTASAQSQSSSNGNVLLFVPAAGSSLTASAARIAKAHQELDALVAKGVKLPSRVVPASNESVEWRYGVPEYVLTDLAYVRGRLREPDATPLASYVEECCQTFIMEATHKARYDQWRSVCQESFYLQVNDGELVPGAGIRENAMLGLLYLGGMGAGVADSGDSDESLDPRAELAEAFPDGFPMEVLDVFTQPPQCYFSWRHWGPFTGKYRGVKGDGSKVEIRGFGEMTVDASRMRSLRLFFKHKDLFSSLRGATDRVARARRDTATISALSSMTAVPGRQMRAASAAVAPVSRKGSVPSAKTSDIIEGLANFTLEAKAQHRKQTR